MAALMVWGATTAVAGGPTSVVVNSPETKKAAMLAYSDKEYGRLQRLLDEPVAGSWEKVPQNVSESGHRLNVIWLAHDISPWRVESVHPIGSRPDGAVWIHTFTNVSEEPKSHWHLAKHPAELRSLLGELGVLGEGTGRDDTAQAADAGSAAVRVGSATSSQDGAGWSANWWWAAPGAAAGAVLALMLRPFATRLTRDRWRREPGPRQELRDA